MFLVNKKPLQSLLKIFWLGIALGQVFLVNGQDKKEEKDSPREIDQIYQEFIGYNRLVFNGRAYGHFYPQAAGDQFLINKQLQTGNIIHDGIPYESIKLNYDIYNDIVYFLWTETNIKSIILNQDRLSQFSLAGMDFIRVKPKEIQNLESGYYQNAFLGKESKILIKKQKKLIKQSRSPTSNKWYTFVEADIYYLILDGKAVSVKNKKDILTHFENNEPLISYIKKEKIKFRSKSETFLYSLIKVLTFIDEQ